MKKLLTALAASAALTAAAAQAGEISVAATASLPSGHAGWEP